ncbi:mCG144676, partial [Mus musculus]
WGNCPSLSKLADPAVGLSGSGSGDTRGLAGPATVLLSGKRERNGEVVLPVRRLLQLKASKWNLEPGLEREMKETFFLFSGMVTASIQNHSSNSERSGSEQV